MGAPLPGGGGGGGREFNHPVKVGGALVDSVHIASAVINRISPARLSLTTVGGGTTPLCYSVCLNNT